MRISLWSAWIPQALFVWVIASITPNVASASEQAGPNPSNLTPTGTQNVSLFTGAFTYTYPIEVPPGRQGVQPDLSLLYNSQAQNGWVGLGWNLSLGSIQRSSRNGIPTYTDSLDTFILQYAGVTEQLVSIGTGTDSRGTFTEYRAQIESEFMRVRYYAAISSAAFWVATSKDGDQHEFQGLGQNSTNSKFFYWGLTKKFDPRGNFMQVLYPSLLSPTTSGAPAPDGSPTALASTRAVLGYLPTSIGYTGKCTPGTCLTVTQSTGAQVIFTYEVRPDTQESWNVEAQQRLTTRLKTIKTTSGGSAVRTYQLTYGTNTIGSSLLTHITIAGSSGAPSISTATFSYSDNTSYSVSLSTAYQLPVDISQTNIVDVNGDGLPDIVQYYTGIGSGAWLNTGSGWVASSTWIPPTALITPNPYSASGGDQGVRFADVNGDGLVDVLQARDAAPNLGITTSSAAWLNTGNGWSSTSSWIPRSTYTTPFNGASMGTALVDVNGDGLPDDIHNIKTNLYLCVPPYGTTTLYSYASYLNTGSGWVSTGAWVPPNELIEAFENDPFVGSGCPTAYQRDGGVRVTDLNMDGLTDILIGNTISTAAGVNTGRGWAAATQWLNPVAFVNGNADTGLRVVDINGDGLPDLVQYSTGPSTVHVWLNTGNGWTQKDSFAGSLSSITTNNMLQFLDFNGDNVADLVALSTNPDSNRVFIGTSSPFNVMTEANNGLGGITSISYAFSPPPTQEGVSLPPVTVVRSVSQTGGISGSADIASSYSYSGGVVNRKRPYREFLGFQQVTVTDGQGNYSITEFLQNQSSMSGVCLFKGMVSSETRYGSAGTILSQSTYTVSFSTPFPGVFFPFVSQADSFLGSSHSAAAFIFDAYGNKTGTIEYGEIGVSGDERTTLESFSGSTSSYLVGYPISKRVFSGAGSGGALLAQASFYFDSSYTQNPTLGDPTKAVNMLIGGQDTVLISSFDVYGNLINTYDARYNASGGTAGNHIRTTYETAFNQFPQSVQQGVGSPLGLPPETFTYDAGTGQILTHVDVNGSTTSYSYDAFGRLSNVIGPRDQVSPSSPTLTFQYFVSTAPPHSILAQSRVISGSTVTLAAYSFFDGLRRKIQSKSAAPGGKQVVAESVSFDSLGLAATSYVPIDAAASASYLAPVSTQPRSLTTYDGLGRVTRVVNPDGGISTRAYQGWMETATDPNGHSKSYLKNAYGWTVEVDERNGTTTYVTSYRFDLLGNMTGIVNSLGISATYFFDSLSRKTGMDDPQMGDWGYDYDPNGNLIQQTDAKNQAIVMTYDAINRMTFKVYPDSTTVSWSYDSDAFAKGRLSEVVDLSGSEEFAYDADGNVLARTKAIGASVYVTSMTYDAMGRVSSLAYPDGIVVNNNYDGSALSTVVSASGSLTYAALTYSSTAPTKIGAVAYGNGMASQYAYDSSMLWLSTLTAQASTNTFQSFAYQYDKVGNITQITDGVAGSTQIFSYDALDRLSQSSGPYGTGIMDYDSTGNLLAPPNNVGGFWNFADTSGLTSVHGLATSTSGRVGNGLGFDGSSQASIDGSALYSTPGMLTISMWLRPRALGTDYAVARSSSYFFPKIESNGSLSARLNLSTGEKSINISSAPLFNLWRYYALTYDGAYIRIYVNGELWHAESASGTIRTSASAILLGSGLTGTIDELGIYPYALTAAQISQRYALYPDLSLSQPLVPDSVPGGMTSGATHSTYTFAFSAWDLNGNDVSYRIDWGTGGYQDTAYVPSGAAVQSTHYWTSAGQYSIRMQAIQPSTSSSWSPALNIFISTPVQAALEAGMLIGASGNAGASPSNRVANTAGEPATGSMNSAQSAGFLGFQSTAVAQGNSTVRPLGPQGSGGTDAAPTPESTASDLVTLQYTTAPADVSAIALNLLEHGATSFVDANGNRLVTNGRWISYDYENRPARIVTPEATLLQFAYDFQGARTRQIITAFGESSRTVSYIGGIYDIEGSSTIKYVSAGALRIASIDSAGATTYFLPDQLGSTNLLVNSGAGAARSLRYLPFGESFQAVGSVEDEHKFAGQRLDAESGLYYLGARYYDQFSGQFISPDSILQDPYDPQLLNRHAYSRNNPLKFIDPDGHVVAQAALVAIGAGAAIYGGYDYWQGRNLEAFLQGAGKGALISSTLVAAAAFAPFSAASLALAGGIAGSLHGAFYAKTPMQALGYTAFGATLGGGAGVVGLGPSGAAMGNIVGGGAASQAANQVNQIQKYISQGSGSIDPKLVRYAQDSVNPFFKSGGSLSELIARLRGPGGVGLANQIPPIRLVPYQESLFTLDHRRLVVFRSIDLPIPYRMATPIEIAKEWSSKFKTTPDQGMGRFISVRPPPGWTP